MISDKMLGDIMARNTWATNNRDRSTELDKLQYWEGQVDAFEFVLSRLTTPQE